MKTVLKSTKTVIFLSGIVLLFLLAPAAVLCQETDDTTETEDTTITGDTETDTATRDVNWNESQSLKAENVAAAAAEELTKEAEKAIADLETAQADLETAQNTLTDLQANPDATAEDIATAEEAVENATATVEKAEKAADEAAANAMSVDVDTVKAMREEGMGWGVICHELGVHPSVLGNALGKEKKNQVQTENTFREKAANAWGKVKDTFNNTFEPNNKGKSNKGNSSDTADLSGNSPKDKSNKSNNGNKSGGNKSGGKSHGRSGNHGGGHGKK